MKVVLDTSVIFHVFSDFYPDRTAIAEKIIQLAELGIITVYAPRFGEIEFITVLSRYFGKRDVEKSLELYSAIVCWVPEELIFSTLREVAFELKHNASDLYFIATARYLNAVLITNDKKMAELAKKLDIETFYMIEEAERFFRRVEVEV